MPEGYTMKYFGEQESQAESNAALAANLPLTFFLMFVTLLFLFRSYRKPIVILLMLPLIFIGIVLGLVVLGKSFDFFSILGLLGLIGMNIKNAIVLVDQIDTCLLYTSPAPHPCRAYHKYGKTQPLSHQVQRVFHQLYRQNLTRAHP